MGSLQPLPIGDEKRSEDSVDIVSHKISDSGSYSFVDLGSLTGLIQEERPLPIYSTHLPTLTDPSRIPE